MLECHLQSLQTRPRARKRGAYSDSSGSEGGEVDFKREAKSNLSKTAGVVCQLASALIPPPPLTTESPTTHYCSSK